MSDQARKHPPAGGPVGTEKSQGEAEDGWDRELDCTGIAERINAARSRERDEPEETLKQWTPIYVPPGKENTAQGRLAMRMNRAGLRVALMDKYGISGWSECPEWKAFEASGFRVCTTYE